MSLSEAVNATTTTGIPQGNWAIDPSHSNIGFAVKHLGIATVRGQFTEFSGTIDASTGTAQVAGTVEVASISTHNEQRDGHLLAPDFFDAEKHPQITFRSTAIETTDGGKVSVAGELTIKGITKPVQLSGEVAGPQIDPWDKERIGLEVKGKIDRREFDLEWNQTLPGGNLLVSNEVKLLINVSVVKKG